MTPTSIRTPVGIVLNLLFLILLAWAGYHWLHTIQRVVRFYNPLPADDYWRVPQELHNYQQFNVSALWRQHNEHRILIPELFFACDMLLFHGEQLLPLTVNFMIYVGCWILAVIALDSDRGMSAITRRFAAVVSAIVIGWPGSAFVLATPFLLNWTLVQFSTCLSLLFLWRRKVTSHAAYLWAAIFAAVVATYSSGNGMLLWPVLLIVAFVLELRKRDIIALAASAFLSIAVYFIGYDRTGTLHIAELFRHPFYTLGFVSAYLSMPLGAERPNSFALTSGFVCIFVACYFFWLARRNHLLKSSPAVLFFGFFGFAMLTALLTAAGRMDVLYDKFFFAAKPVRYVTMPLLNWAFFLTAALWIADRIRSKSLLAVSSALTAAVLLLLISHRARDWARTEDVEKADQQLAALDVENGVPDIKLTKSIFPNVEFINQYAPDLEKSHLSIYYDGPAEWLGKPLHAIFKDFGPMQSGKITLAAPVQHGLELAGTANVPAHTSLTDPQIVFVNSAGQIVGFGRHLHAGVARQIASAWPAAPLQWVGFINFNFGARAVHAYLVSGSKLFPLDISIPTAALPGHPL